MSYLATLERDGDEYVKNGVHLGQWDVALGSLLGFCGCGQPRAALAYLLRILRTIDARCPRDDEADAIPYEQWSKWYDTTHRPAIDAIFHGDDGAEYLAYYLLADKDLTEHGGSVPGWLTALGKDVLADLEAHSAELEEA